MQVPNASRGVIVLSGATGFMAGKLGQVLVRQGFQIRALVRDPAAVRGLLPYPATLHAWDGRDAQGLGPLVEGAFAVVHLAGENVAGQRWSESYKKRILESRRQSAQALVAAVNGASRKPQVFIQASAVGFYGDQKDRILTESSLAGDDFLARVCTAWEEPVKALPQDVRAVVLRFGMVLGLSGGVLGKLARLYALGLGAVLGTGKQWVSWIHLDDVCGMVTEALVSDRFQGTYNAAAPEPVPFREFHGTLAEIVGKASPWRAPAFALRVGLGEQAQIVLGSQRVSAAKVMGAGYRFLYPELENALLSQFADQRTKGVLWHIRKIWVPRPVAEIWSFFCDESNLEALTPPLLRFKVLGKSTPAVGKGTLIDYTLRVRGLPMRWQTRIEEWQPESLFADNQLKGPYRLWYHRHHFYPLAGGTVMVDEVQFTLPLGRLGYGVAGWLVEKDVKTIFDHRQRVIAERFGDAGETGVQ